MINYFAYGHNSNTSEMTRRIPEAKLLGTGELQGWRFTMEHYSNIIRDPSSSVKGVLWSMPEHKLGKLDWDEGYGKNYGHKNVTIMLDGKPIRAMAYVMLPDYFNDKPPSRKYIDWIAAGYRANGIPLSQLIHALEHRITHVRDAHGMNKKNP